VTVVYDPNKKLPLPFPIIQSALTLISLVGGRFNIDPYGLPFSRGTIFFLSMFTISSNFKKTNQNNAIETTKPSCPPLLISGMADFTQIAFVCSVFSSICLLYIVLYAAVSATQQSNTH